jgi:hypothetical protein
LKSLLLGLSAIALSLLATGCATTTAPAGDSASMATLSEQPLDSQAWQFGASQGVEIQTPHYRVFTTIRNGLYQHLIARILEAAHTRFEKIVPGTTVDGPMNCFVFGDRSTWEIYTKLKSGSNAQVYLQITAGGYAQQGIFAGYDIGRDQTLSVIAHEAWHQYSWFAFKDRLPSWLEEGLATQNEAIDWEGTTPIFTPALNYRRFMALREAQRQNRLWSLNQITSTHAGRVIKLSQPEIDTYYAQLWSFVLFLEHTPKYKADLTRLLQDATAGRLVSHLAGKGVSPLEIAIYSEHWNKVAGPVYLADYFNADTPTIEREYRNFVRSFVDTWPPSVGN